MGRLETSKEFAVEKIKKEKPKAIKHLKMTVRLLNEDDIKNRDLPKETTGVVITKIESDSPVKYLEVNDVIVEVKKIKIKSIDQLNNLVTDSINAGEKTLLFAVYNNQNQRRYLGIKLK